MEAISRFFLIAFFCLLFGHRCFLQDESVKQRAKSRVDCSSRTTRKVHPSSATHSSLWKVCDLSHVLRAYFPLTDRNSNPPPPPDATFRPPFLRLFPPSFHPVVTYTYRWDCVFVTVILLRFRDLPRRQPPKCTQDHLPRRWPLRADHTRTSRGGSAIRLGCASCVSAAPPLKCNASLSASFVLSLRRV